jgi:hypothetical protein
MTICVAVSEEGFLYQTDLPITECTSMVIQSVGEYNTSHIELSPADIATVFAWSFGAVVVVGYFGGYVIGLAKRLINLI